MHTDWARELKQLCICTYVHIYVWYMCALCTRCVLFMSINASLYCIHIVLYAWLLYLFVL